MVEWNVVKYLWSKLTYFEEFLLYLTESHFSWSVYFVLDSVYLRDKLWLFCFFADIFKDVHNIIWSLI